MTALLMRDDIDLAVHAERQRQDERWGEQNFPDGTGRSSDQVLMDQAKAECSRAFAEGQGTFRVIFMEEVREVLAEAEPTRLRSELIQVMAVAKQWIQAIDRRSSKGDGLYVRPKD